MMAFKGWVDAPWRDVAENDRVRTADGREWIVRHAWNGERVLLAQEMGGTFRTIYGPTVPVPLTDGDKVVKRFAPLRTPDGKTVPLFDGIAAKLGGHEYRPGNGGCWWGDCKAAEDDPVHTPAARPATTDAERSAKAERERQHQLDCEATADPMAPGMPDPCQPIGCDNGIHLPGCTFAEVDAEPGRRVNAFADVVAASDARTREVAAKTRFGRPRPTDEQEDTAEHPGAFAAALGIDDEVIAREIADGPRPKFGQPVDTRTGGETLYGVAADDEGRAVAALARNFPDAELVAVEDVVDGVKVPRELDDLALRSHLFLMHGRFYGETDTERADLERDHRASHAGDPGHEHVDRAEM